jgi:hypothetical protein
MSTAFHPQTDGQTENMNKTLEQMLRAYTNKHQDNWYELLPYAEMAYNNSKHLSTGYSPFFLGAGEEMYLPSSLLSSSSSTSSPHGNVAVEEIITELQTTLKHVQTNLQLAQERQKKYADQNRREELFTVGDKVLLDAIDITFTSGSKKLLDKFIGPYKIIEVISPVAYKLELPQKMRIHNVFHVSKLKRYHSTDSFPDRVQEDRPPPAVLMDGEEYWYVEKIINKKIKNKKIYYEIKWKDYPEWENTWEPIENVKHAVDAINEYEHGGKQ